MKQPETASLESRWLDAIDRIKATGDPVFLVMDSGPASQMFENMARAFIDLPVLAAWRGQGETDGNCLFATTHAALMLIHGCACQNLALPPVALVTGFFDHPEAAPDRLVHAWLEYKYDLIKIGTPLTSVMNVSNLSIRPGYTMDKEIYYKRNHFGGRIERHTLADIRDRAKRFTCDGVQAGIDLDVRLFTHALLKKTRYQLQREAAARRKRGQRSLKEVPTSIQES